MNILSDYRKISIQFTILPILFTIFTFQLYASPDSDLLICTTDKDTKCITTALKAGANINVKDKDGFTALMIAVANADIDSTKLLLSAKPQINDRNSDGVTALTLAALSGFTDIVKILIASGAMVDARDNGQFTPLCHAAGKGNLESIIALLNAKADINATIENGGTSLMLASASGHSKVVELLLNRKAKIDAQTANGMTALMIAISQNQPDVAKILIAHGADTTPKAKNGNTALQFAKNAKLIDIIKLLSPMEGMAYSLPEDKALGIITLVDTNDLPDPGVECSLSNESEQVNLTGRTDTNGQITITLSKGVEYKMECNKFGESMVFNKTLITTNTQGPFIHYVNLKIIMNTKYTSSYALENVFFETNKSNILTASVPALRKLIDTMNKNTNILIEIAGHTDNTGTKERNIQLSRERADSVRSYLIKAGISETRVIAKGYGSLQPVAENKTEKDRKKNRRTEVRIIGN